MEKSMHYNAAIFLALSISRLWLAFRAIPTTEAWHGTRARTIVLYNRKLLKMVRVFYARSLHSTISTKTPRPLSLFKPYLYSADFHRSPFTLPRVQPSLLFQPLFTTSPLHPSTYPSILFVGTLSGTLLLFIKASKPTASSTQPLERRRGDRERGGG